MWGMHVGSHLYTNYLLPESLVFTHARILFLVPLLFGESLVFTHTRILFLASLLFGACTSAPSSGSLRTHHFIGC